MFYKRVIIFIIVVFVFGFVLFDNSTYKNDFYFDVNQEKLDSIKLDDSKYNWSVFKEAQMSSDDTVKEIVKGIINGSNKKIDDNISDKIRIVYDNAKDMNKRNRLGISDLNKYIDRVNDSKNMKELLDGIIDIENDLNVDILTNINIGADYKDNSHYIVYFYPVTYFCGSSSDYYVNPDYMTYKAYLKRGIIEMLEVYGFNKKQSREIMHEVLKFYEDISRNSKLSSDLEDIVSYYNIIDNNEFTSIYSNIDVKYYLSKRGFYKYNNYSIVDKEQYQVLNKSFKEDNLAIWKYIVLLKVLSSYAMYSSDNYVEVIDNINKGIIGGNDGKSNDDKNVDIVSGLFSGDIDYLYSDIISSKDKKKISDMTDDIVDYYKVMIKNNTWLSEDTKKNAILKIDNMKFHIGLEEYDKISEKYDVDNTSLINNVIDILRAHRNRDFLVLDGNKKTGNDMSQSTVNAYYSLTENAIYVPSAIRYLYDEDSSYYQMLGSIGMILSHEITHAIDTNGSKFDSKGNISNWWLEKDYDNYMKYKNKVIDYYSQYKVINGKYIDGEKTVNENIADLGAVSCISGIAIDKKASDKEIKEMYEAFAKMWASKERREYAELLLLQDTHSPNKYRVNAVLSSTDLFYKVYNIRPWNKMYKNKKKRVYVW